MLIRFWFGFGAGKKGGLHDGICYGFPARPNYAVWGCEILCKVGDSIWLSGNFSPTLIAEKRPYSASVAALSNSALRRGIFVRDLAGSDGVHWGDGVVMVNADRIWLDGRVAPGPDYRLYLAPKYVETRPGFQTIKAQLPQIGPIIAFVNFHSSYQMV